MGEVVWDSRKNEQLKLDRGISFEAVVEAMGAAMIADIYAHPNQKKYPSQLIAVVWLKGYAHLVPFTERDGVVRLITIIPSRKATRKHFGSRR